MGHGVRAPFGVVNRVLAVLSGALATQGLAACVPERITGTGRPPCDSDYDCLEGDECLLISGFFGTPRRGECFPGPAADGEPCALENPRASCQSGLECAPADQGLTVSFANDLAESLTAYWEPGGQCFHFTLIEESICRLVGAIGVGGLCSSDRNCAQGLVCNDAYQPTAQCRPPGDVGDPCAFGTDCRDGLSCSDVVASDATCNATSSERVLTACPAPGGCDLQNDSDCREWVRCARACTGAAVSSVDAGVAAP